MWFAWICAALAHEPGLSRIAVEDDTLVLQVARVDAAEPMALLSGTTVTVGDRPCTLGEVDVRPDDNGFVATVPFDCPAGDAVAVHAGWFAAMAPGHRTLVGVDGEPAGWLDAANPTFETARRPSASATALGYLGLGIEHILTGWDHLVFLAGLLLVARSLKEIASVVTGFTIAHSVTLSLAALGWVHVSGAIVEPAIAASIVFVGLENLLDPPAKRRFLLTLALGLIHGLGFAGLLQEIGLPQGQVPIALAMFNVGVECGQFGVVLVALPALLALRRTAWWPSTGVRAGSLVVASLGLFWLVTRLVGELGA